MIESTMARMTACSMPTTTTVAAVRRATTNSPDRTRAMPRMPAMSMSLRPMSKTTAARTAFGMYCRAGVRKSRTSATNPPATSCESWVLPPAPSTIWVLVGLPLTTNVPLSPAPRLATESPTRSTFSLKLSSYLAA